MLIDRQFNFRIKVASRKFVLHTIVYKKGSFVADLLTLWSNGLVKSPSKRPIYIPLKMSFSSAFNFREGPWG